MWPLITAVEAPASNVAASSRVVPVASRLWSSPLPSSFLPANFSRLDASDLPFAKAQLFGHSTASLARSPIFVSLGLAILVLVGLHARNARKDGSSWLAGRRGSAQLELGAEKALPPPPVVHIPRHIQLSEAGHEAYARALDEHGDVVVIPRHGRMEYVVDYAHVKDVLTDAQHYSFEKAVTTMLHMEFMLWFKNGTFVQELDKLVQDGVTPRLRGVVDKIAPVFSEDVANLFKGLPKDAEVTIEDSYQFCHHAIARAMVILILGEQYLDEATTEQFMSIVGAVAHLAGIYENTQSWARFPKLYAFFVTMRAIFGTVIPVYFFRIVPRVWSNRSAHLDHGIDVDSSDFCPFFDLLAAKHRSRRTGRLSFLNFVWCSIVVLGIIFASVHQSAVIAAWCVVNLAKRTEYQDEIRAEIDEVLEVDELGQRVLTAESLRRAERLDSFIRETMRTMGSLFAPVRYTTQPVRVGKYMLPKDALVAPYVRRAHEHPANYGDEGQVFNGRRWVGDKAAVTGTPEFITFGLGRWACPGRHLAIAELKMITATLFDSYHVELVGGHFEAADPMNATSVGPKGVLKLRRRV